MPYNLGMIDQDAHYEQQKGLKLTAEERRRHSFPLRYFISVTVLYLIFLAGSLAIFLPRIERNFSEGGYIEAYRRYVETISTAPTEVFPVFLFSKDGPVLCYREIETGFKDNLHLTLEALLLPSEDVELGEGLISFIPEGTKLVGVSRKGKLVVAAFSHELLSSPDIEKAIEQIEKTLSVQEDNLRVAIMVGQDVIG